MSGAKTQDEVIDHLSLYLMEIVSISEDTASAIETAHMDGVIMGLAMAVGIAAGVPGPLTALELARIGTDLAKAVADRVTGKEESL